MKSIFYLFVFLSILITSCSDKPVPETVVLETVTVENTLDSQHLSLPPVVTIDKNWEYFEGQVPCKECNSTLNQLWLAPYSESKKLSPFKLKETKLGTGKDGEWLDGTYHILKENKLQTLILMPRNGNRQYYRYNGRDSLNWLNPENVEDIKIGKKYYLLKTNIKIPVM